MYTKETYYLNPKKCQQCGNTISYANRRGKFCSKSCSCSHRNHNHKQSDETKEKQRNASKLNRFKLKCIIKVENCKICNKFFIYSRDKSGFKSTCSKECNDIIFKNIGLALCKKHNNQKMYGHHSFNSKYHGEIKLDSKWEIKVVKSLEDNNIKWERGKGFVWIRPTDNTEHTYYPDFYLPEYDVFIEPKNPYRWKTDLNFEQFKIKYVIEKYNITIIMVLDKHDLSWDFIKTKIPLAV